MRATEHRRPLSPSTRLRLHWRRHRQRKLSERDSFLFDELLPGDIAVDCGANIGSITKLMAIRGAQVHAFEPDPFAFRVLEEKFRSNPNVLLNHCAVSDRAAEMKLYFREEQPDDPVKFSVGSTLLPAKSDVNEDHFVMVPVVSLAEYLMQFDRVRLLKIDIEGAECAVLGDLMTHGMFDRIDLTLVETHETWIPELKPRIAEISRKLKESKTRSVFLNWI